MKKIADILKKDREMIFFLVAIFVFYFAWAVVAPFNASPDEGMRYQIVEFIMKYGSLPDGRDPEIRNIYWGISYAFNPILPYIAGAVFGKIAECFTQDLHTIVVAVRMVNVFLGMGTGCFVWKIGERLFKRKEAARLFSIFVCFLPGTCFLFSYINTDGLALFTVSWILFCWCKACQDEWNLAVCIQLGVAMGLCMLSYYNAYGYLLMSAIFFVGCMMKCQEKRWDYPQMLKKGCLMLVLVFLVAGWWFIRSGILYDGDFLGMKTSSIYAEKYAIDELKPSNRVLPVNMGMSIWDMMCWVPGEWKHNWLITVMVSFVGTFGQMDIFMPYWWSKLYLIVLGIGLLGNGWKMRQQFAMGREDISREEIKDEKGILITSVWRKTKQWDTKKWMHTCMAISICIPIALLIYYAYASDFQAQGRYIMPMVIPFMYFVVLGYENWLNKLLKKEKIKIWFYRFVQGATVLSAVLTYFLVYRISY